MSATSSKIDDNALRVGFYLAPDLPVEQVLPQIARKAASADQRMLVVAEDEDLLARLDRALWTAFPQDFLAHGFADNPHAERQPILLSQSCETQDGAAPNGARLLAIADGKWRDAANSYARVLLFFDDTGRDAARDTWRLFNERPEVEREFYEHISESGSGQWVKKR